MGLEGIKLIACDLDGTLLHPGEHEPRSEAFELIDELHRRGIVFMPASGRQYASLRYLFAPVADELAYRMRKRSPSDERGACRRQAFHGA